MENAGDQRDIEILIQRIGQGDRDSFSEFYDRFSTLIYATSLRTLGDPEDAREVMQDVLFTLWEKAPMYDASRGKPLTWALTMTRNKAIDRLRARQRRQRLNDEVADEPEPHIAEPAFSDIDHSENAELIQRALQRLKPDQRAALELAYFSGLTQQQISERLQEPLGTVKARIRRALLQLKRSIGSALP